MASKELTPVSTSLLQPESVTPQYFGLEIDRGGPTVASLISSLVLHAAVIALLATERFPVSPPKPVEEAALSPTEVRIDNKLYYVADITGLESAKSPIAAPAPRAIRAGSSSAPKLLTPKQPSIPAPKIAVNTPKLGLPDAPATLPDLPAPPPEPARPVIKREQARTFIPPEVKRSPIAERTLIQPLSPPDLVPPSVPLPSFRVMTPELPRIPKPFVSPGRPNPPQPQQVAAIAPMPMEIVSAPPAPTDIQPKLSLPRTPPPPTPAAKPIDGPPPTPVGEPVNILSLSNRNLPVPERLVVPQGNIAQESGNNPNVGPANSTVAANVAPANSNASSQEAASQTPFRPSNASATSNSSTAGTTPGASASSGQRNAGVVNGSPSGATRTGQASAQPGATASAQGEGGNAATLASAASSGTGTGSGRGNTGAGAGAATAGGSSTGSPTATIGGTANSGTGVSAAGVPGGSPVIATPGGGTGAGTGAGRAGQIINRPANGTYDTVVVQSSPLDQYPETRGLLTGRPIYSVYISTGSARDWTLYFCVPNERPPANTSAVVRIGETGTPVNAPYATKLLRPTVAFPSWEKYVLVHGYVTEDGRFEGLRMVRSIQADLDKALLAALTEWEFRAASREGKPLRVEILLSIPAKGL